MGSVGSEGIDPAWEAAITPIVASLAPWGVVGGFVEVDASGSPVLWLRATTEIGRVELQAQAFLLPQVQIILTRLGLPYAMVRDLRLAMTSVEAESS
ncbi:hypothetical protein D9V37_15225 [Nocardioides mangrovicus]|uniref:Uncharacterized protein n=1 Tax=Nocardioides mangrovicus TaxID=2478913 RepID=A0A3L8NYU0_9ACTN|nr:hypothetical protein [Nocardioides mangrovicus]RLV47529.1 hypothetical protein D9V37_15225 [Nocardioides mangrovicus]